VRWLLLKDLRILQRSPLLVGMLVLYPALIGVLIGFALSSPPGKPKVAIYTGVPVGHSEVSFGGEKIDVSRYARELYSSISPIRASSPAAAIADVRSGKALAALIIPADTIRQIQSEIATGEGNPTLQVVLNDRNPLERDLVQQALQTRIDDVQNAITKQVLQTIETDLRLVLSGGRISFLGETLDLLGLKATRTVVEGTVDSLPHGSVLVPPLQQVIRFAGEAIDGLALAGPQINSVGSPLTVHQRELSGRTTPVASYAVAIAAVVLLMFVTLLLAAGMLALERSENAYRRLIGLLRPGVLLAEKVALATACALLLTVVLSAILSAFVALSWDRFELWVLALGVGGLAFASLGVAVGALARDVSIASLLAFLVSLPVAFVALVPGTAVAGGLATVLNVISFIFPFRATLQAVANAFSGAAPGIGLPLLHLVGLSLVFAVLARLGLTRFADW
jgi:ABC-type transport system involved in cytochrome c biogenesis permease component